MLHPVGTSPGHRDEPARPLLRTKLGEVLRRIRQEQGRTLADVAGAAAVSMQYLSELERGRKEASSEVLAALCEALRVELPDVLAEVGRDLAGASEYTAVVIRLGPADGLSPLGPAQGLRQPSSSRRTGDVVSLLAA